MGAMQAVEDGEVQAVPADAGVATARRRSPIVKWVVIALLVLLVIGALAWGWRWWTHGRFVETTNDAYLRADFVIVSSKVAGYVDRVLVEDNQPVRRGQPLLILDAVDYRAAASQAIAAQGLARAGIAGAEAAIGEQAAAVEEARAQLAKARATAAIAATNAARYAELSRKGAEPTQKYDDARLAAASADAEVRIATASLAAAERRVGLLRAQRDQADAQRDAANAQRTRADADLSAITIRASIDGIVANRAVRAGQFIQPARRLMSVVPVQEIYLVANFKETQTGAMRVGQPVDIEVDALPGIDLKGRVESFAPGTGAQFSLLPPENATGNFTKIVQRVPVRIAIQAGPETRAVLRPGLSVHAAVDTSSAKGAIDRIRQEQRRLASAGR